MNDFESYIVEKDIPRFFKTFVSEEPFEFCINCEKYLLDQGTYYMIEKAISGGYVEFEHAICLDCAQEMRGYMSEESMNKVNTFFSERFNEFDRIIELNNEYKEPSSENWLKNCAITNKPIEELSEYQVYAHCNGNQIVYSAMPFAISGEIIEDVSGLLSAKTKEELDNYMDKHFGFPPEWKEALKNKKIVLF